LTPPTDRRTVAPVRRRQQISAWITRWGFPILVAGAVAAGLLVAVTAPVPVDVPSVALRAAVVYRIEVGAAIFAGLYLMAMAFVLALHNQAFSEFGTNGVKALDIADQGQQRAITEHESALRSVGAMVNSAQASIEDLDNRVNRLEQRSGR
jgi:hypothetical protein